jgi:hypothetical protein
MIKVHNERFYPPIGQNKFLFSENVFEEYLMGMDEIHLRNCVLGFCLQRYISF